MSFSYEIWEFFSEFFASIVSQILSELSGSQTSWRKWETFFTTFHIYNFSYFHWALSFHFVIVGVNRELLEAVGEISRNFLENSEMRKSEKISELFWEIFVPGIFIYLFVWINLTAMMIFLKNLPTPRWFAYIPSCFLFAQFFYQH